MKHFVLFIAAVIICATNAAEITVYPGTTSTVNTAIAAAYDGDVILLTAGTYTGCTDAGIVLNKNVALRGVGATTIIDCAHTGTAIFVTEGFSNVVIESLSIFQAELGISIAKRSSCDLRYVSIMHSACVGLSVDYYSAVNLYNVNVIGSGCSGVRVDQGSLTIIDSLLDSNGGPLVAHGGGVSAYYSSVSITNSRVTNNMASEGGGLYVDGTALSISGCVISGNNASSADNHAAGGGLFAYSPCGPYNRWSTVTVSDSMILNNSAVNDGGGIAAYCGDVTVYRSTISNNTATSAGGGVYVDTSYEYQYFQFDAFDSLIINNKAGYSGGFFAGDVDVTLSNVTLDNNIAGGCGGGAVNSMTDLSRFISVAASRVTNNVASGGRGGGLCLYQVHASISNSSISDNHAAGDGGGVFAEYVLFSTASVTVLRNSASTGGGMYLQTIDYSADNTVYSADINGIIEYNVATVNGGGIYVGTYKFSLNLIDSVIRYNTRGGLGFIGPPVFNCERVRATNSTVICGNSDYQSSGLVLDYHSGCYSKVYVNFGNITEVYNEGMLNATLYPGLGVRIDVTNMFHNSSDYISLVFVGTSSTSVKAYSAPFSFIIPAYSDDFTGRIRVVTALGRQAETYEQYNFKADDLFDCAVSVSNVYPLAVKINTSAKLSMSLNVQCLYNVPVVCYFGDVRVLATSLNMTMAAFIIPTSTTARIVPFTIEIKVPGNEYNLTGRTFQYYPMPTPSSVAPAVAHNSLTNVTVCGIVQYPWAKPVCAFDSVIVDAAFVNAACVKCLYTSLLPCRDHPLVFVRVRMLIDQVSEPYVTVNHTCVPSVVGVPNPQYVLILSNMTSVNVSVSGAEYYQSEWLLCRFGDDVVHGTAVMGAMVQCPVPYRESVSEVRLEVTNDGQNWVYAGNFTFTDGGMRRCDPGHQNNAVFQCELCPLGMLKNEFLNLSLGKYKSMNGIDYCFDCGDYMTTHAPGATSIDQCICAERYMSAVTDYSSCECSSGYYFDRGRCEPCPDGQYKSSVSNGVCEQCPSHSYCPVGSSSPSPDTGYYSVDGQYVTCIPPEACLIGSQCADGYEGERCSRCSKGYYRNQLECVECSGSFSLLRIIVIGVTVLCVVAYLYRASLKGRKVSVSLAAISIAYNFVTVFSLIGSVPTDQVRDPYKSTFQVASTFTFNFQVMALECDYPSLDYFGMLMLKLLAPVVLLFSLLLVMPFFSLVRCMCNVMRSYSHDVKSAAVSTVIVMISLLYLTLVSAVLSYVSCTVLDDGRWILDASPDIQCFNGRHVDMMPLFLCGVFVYAVGVPVILYYIIVIKRKSLTNSNRALYAHRYGFLMNKYRGDVYWYVKFWRGDSARVITRWEFAVILRKAMLVLAFTIWSRSIALKIELALLVLITAAVYHASYKPLVIKQLDDIEKYTLLANSLLLVAGLGMFVRDDMSTGSSAFTYVLFYVMIGICVGIILWIIVVVAKYQDDDQDNDVEMDNIGQRPRVGMRN